MDFKEEGIIYTYIKLLTRSQKYNSRKKNYNLIMKIPRLIIESACKKIATQLIITDRQSVSTLSQICYLSCKRFASMHSDILIQKEYSSHNLGGHTNFLR